MNEHLLEEVREALDTASRHWRDEYDRMTTKMVADRRRQTAIDMVCEALALYDLTAPLTITDTASLIVDNSEIALVGFDAVPASSPTTWWRRMTRQITNVVVTLIRV